MPLLLLGSWPTGSGASITVAIVKVRSAVLAAGAAALIGCGGQESEEPTGQPEAQQQAETEKRAAQQRAEAEHRARWAGWTARVSEVIDGDTIELEGVGRVRLIGVDTPERGEECYEEATDFLRRRVGGKTVRYRSRSTGPRGPLRPGAAGHLPRRRAGQPRHRPSRLGGDADHRAQRPLRRADRPSRGQRTRRATRTLGRMRARPGERGGAVTTEALAAGAERRRLHHRRRWRLASAAPA